ncbi:MAG: FAD-dependent oxidoreductase [Tetrasphaera sp.]
MKDVVVVGGGIAGLAAAWRLRHWDIAVLEAGPRVGGRIKSERRGTYWMNWGGHVFAGAGSASDALFTEVGINAVTVPGSLKGMGMNGVLLTRVTSRAIRSGSRCRTGTGRASSPPGRSSVSAPCATTC